MTESAADTAEFTSEAYEGCYRASYEYARNLIAACPTFREAIIGAGSDDEAKEKIFYRETYAEENDEEQPEREGDRPPEYEARPYCLLTDGARSRRRAGVGEWASEGHLLAVFEVPVPSEYAIDYDQDDAAGRKDKFRRSQLWRINLVSKLEDEIVELAGSADAAGNPYLNVHTPELILAPADAEADVVDEPFIGFIFRLAW